MLRIFLLFMLLFLAACKTSHCSGDGVAIAEYQRRYDLIKSAEEANVEVYVEEYREALFYLSYVTG
jgi:hypothetical protein